MTSFGWTSVRLLVVVIPQDYMDKYKCFTWNDQGFPDAARFSQSMRDQGFRLIVILDPGLKIDNQYEGETLPLL